MEHRFYTLDVFTSTRFEGNPLAVFTDGDELSDDEMLAIAREMNLSETVFVQKPTEEEALARLRIFTTKEELRLAGGAGVLPVEIRFKDGRPQRVTMTQREAIFKPAKIDKKRLASALGLSPKDFDPKLEPEFVSTGIFNLMVPLRNRAALGKIATNMIELRKLQGKNATMAYCFALGGNGRAFSRGMLPWELYEDAATGSAAGSLGAYLVRHGKLTPGHTLSILQGAEMGRPSHLEVEVTRSGKKLIPRVSGAAVKVFEGTIRI